MILCLEGFDEHVVDINLHRFTELFEEHTVHESLVSCQNLKFTYGNFEVNYVYDQAKNQVVSTAKFNISNHVIPAAKYTELQVFLDNVYKAQNKKLVIRRKA